MIKNVHIIDIAECNGFPADVESAGDDTSDGRLGETAWAIQRRRLGSGCARLRLWRGRCALAFAIHSAGEYGPEARLLSPR